VHSHSQVVLMIPHEQTWLHCRVEANAAARYDYAFDKLRRLTQERKRGTGQGTPLHYQKDFAYDRAGNRTSYRHQNGPGYNYGLAVNYNSYTYDVMGRLTQIRDSGRNFTATITNDWNGNITQVTEVIPGTLNATSTFAYDYENRLTEFAIGGSGFSAEHTYDGFNRLIKTDATVGQNTQNFEHVYAGRRHVGSREVTGQPVNGKVWRWETGAGAVDHAPIEAPQWSSASGGNYFQVNDERNMSRRAYAANMAAGDTTEQTRYSDWYYVNGGLVPARPALGAAKSELFTAYAITLDADRCSTPYTNHALNLAQTDLEFEVTRVKSPILGRDLNPLGRGDGTYYCNGGNAALSSSVAVRSAKPRLTGESAIGFGSSMNNQCCGAGAGTGNPPSDGGALEERPPTIWIPKYGIEYQRGLEDGQQVKLYYNLLLDACKSNSSPHCDMYTYDHTVSSYSHQCCSNACYRQDAMRVAQLVNEHCKGACEAIVALMARTFKEQTQKPEPPIWGIYVVFGCHPAEVAQHGDVPLLQCWCKVRAGGDMPGWAFMECLQDVLGVGPGCTAGIPKGQDDGEGQQPEDDCQRGCLYGMAAYCGTVHFEKAKKCYEMCAYALCEGDMTEYEPKYEDAMHWMSVCCGAVS